MPEVAFGFDSMVRSTCYASARYVVVERELEDHPGSDLYVRPRAVPDAALRCDADSVGGDIVFRTGRAPADEPFSQHFLGLKGDLLVTWDGTGASSDLYIHDLKTRAKALVVYGADIENLQWVAPMAVTVWVTKASAQSAVAAGCPDTVPGNPAQLDSLMRLDLATLALRATDRHRCGVGQ
jgi:hypothetical protein